MSDQMVLRCPVCGKLGLDIRRDIDPPEAVLAEIECEPCVQGGFGTIRHFDADDNILPVNPE